MDSPNTIVVVGASAGGVSALKRLVSGVDPTWPIAMFITLHIGRHRSVIPDILGALTPNPVSMARHGQPFARGIYVAPPDRHLIVSRGKTLLSDGPKENYARPAIDPMFRSAAKVYGSAVVAVLLSGYLSDGMNGLLEVHQAGGYTIVQDPNDAEVPEIPLNAIRKVEPSFVLPLVEIPEAIAWCLKEGKRADDALAVP